MPIENIPAISKSDIEAAITECDIEDIEHEAKILSKVSAAELAMVAASLIGSSEIPREDLMMEAARLIVEAANYKDDIYHESRQWRLQAEKWMPSSRKK